jgi:hypothetical protein
VIEFDHVAIAQRDISATLNTLVGDFGTPVLFGGANVGFRAMQVDAGACRIELLEPWNVESNDFLERFLDRAGEGPHHLTFKTDDIRRDLGRAEAAGFQPVGVLLGNPWWQEAFLHPKQAGGTVVQLAQSGMEPTDTTQLREMVEQAGVSGEYGPGQWWPDPPVSANERIRLDRVVVTTEDLDVAMNLYEDLLGGRNAGYGDGWVDLTWPSGGCIRVEAAAGRTPGIDRLEWTHGGAYTERVVGGARFVLCPAT